MIQLPASLDGFNEADVREEIVAPILRHLGYQTGTSANVIREQSLRYPRVFLGRKKPQSDPVLRGRPDYILEVNGAVRWTIETKAPTASVTADDIEQAYSYANHPEVRAVLFCLINGRELRVYQTNQGPDVPPVLVLQWPLTTALPTLENLFAPSSIARDYPARAVDSGPPIGPGLRSVVRIVSGFVEFNQSEPSLPLLGELNLFVDEGAIERDENGRLVAYVKARSPFRTINELNNRLGLSQMELVSNDTVLSSDAAAPTVFQLDVRPVLPEGAEFPNLTDGSVSVLTRSLACRSHTIATGTLSESRFFGSLSQTYEYLDIPSPGQSMVIRCSGTFLAVLA